MIKNKLLLVAIVVASILLPAAVRAEGISIEIGDKPFYNHGPRYWAGDSEMIWVAGHMGEGNHWIHGHYVRGQHRRHDLERRHDDRQDDRQNENRDDNRR